jgi:hypothetical protein
MIGFRYRHDRERALPAWSGSTYTTGVPTTKEIAVTAGNARRAAAVRRIALLATAAIAVLAIAAPAALAKGWKIDIKNKVPGGGTARTTAKHCGKTKFGTWSFRGTLSMAGKSALIRWKTVISRDGAPHPTTAVSVTGSAPASGKAAVKQTFESLKYFYAPGSPPVVKTQLADGATFSTLVFRPRPAKRC